MVANLAPNFSRGPFSFRDDAFKMGIKENLKVRNYQPCNWVQSEYTKTLQMLFPIYAVFHELSKNFEAPKLR